MGYASSSVNAISPADGRTGCRGDLQKDPVADARTYFKRLKPLENFADVSAEVHVRAIRCKSRLLHVGAFDREYKDIEALFDLCERRKAIDKAGSTVVPRPCRNKRTAYCCADSAVAHAARPWRCSAGLFRCYPPRAVNHRKSGRRCGGNGATPDKRAAVFCDLPQGNKAMLLLKNAGHMTFGGRSDNFTPDQGGQGRVAGSLPREAVTAQVQPQHHALVVRISMDWWRAHLMGNAAAKVRLQKPQGLAVLHTWQTG